MLTLIAPIATKVVCFSLLLKCLRSLYGKQCGPRYRGAVCSGSTLFASILNSSVMLGNYFQQMTSADNIFRCIFFLGVLRVRSTKILCAGLFYLFIFLFSRCHCRRYNVHWGRNINAHFSCYSQTCFLFCNM